MKVFQIGAGGGIGRRLTGRLVARGDVVSGMHRDESQAAALAAGGATPVLGDLIGDTVEQLAGRMRGHDAVVFSAGAHGTGADKTTLIDGKGLEKSADAAEAAGVSRFLLVSVFPDAARGGEPNEGFEHYMRVKKAADVYLVDTDLDWLIVRPGLLRDDPGTEHVSAGWAVDYGSVPRDDVAAFLAEALAEPRLNRTIVELVEGSTPVADAVARLLPATGDRVGETVRPQASR